MPKSIQNINEKIVGSNGQVLQLETRMEEFTENKFFAAAVMCGHAGKGFFVPVIFRIAAKDKENAIQIIKASPRVKNNSQRCVLGISEISLTEFDYIGYINSCDAYLSHNYDPQDVRKILMPPYAEVIMKEQRGERLTSKERVMLNAILEKTICFAEDYPDHCVLQKTFAPSLVKNRIVYPSKVNMDTLLYQYYKSQAKTLGIKNRKSQVLRFCLQIFGFENEFGFKLDTENCAISFVNENGKVDSEPINETVIEIIQTQQEYRLRNALKKLQKASSDLPEIDLNIKLPTAIERFNARWNKSIQAQASKNKEKTD